MTIPLLGKKLSGPEGRKLFRYSMASVVAIAVSVICLVILNGLIGMSAWLASTLSTGIAAAPSYEMNRRWAWGKTGRSHLWKEVLPFWALAFLGLAFSTICVHAMESYATHHHFSQSISTLSVVIVYVAAFGILWVGKFIILNKVLFPYRMEDSSSELEIRA